MASEHTVPSLPHVYVPIEGADSFRTLRLQPALDVSAPLRFTFDIHSPDSDEEYEAISYTWGAPKLTCPVYFHDGSYVMATKNLDSALRRFRDATKTRVLWANAICINQKDNKEKATQIPLMIRIFRGAHRVLAWLDGGAGEEKGLKLLRRWSRLSRPTIDVRQGDSPFRASCGIQDMSDQDNVFILRFLNHPWFSRLWM